MFDLKTARIMSGSTGVDQVWFTRAEVNKVAKKALDHQQAIIDLLMLEFCPERMTDEQVAAWEAAQQPCSDEQYNAVCISLGLPTR